MVIIGGFQSTLPVAGEVRLFLLDLSKFAVRFVVMALERKKSCNFTKRETEMLVEEVEARRDVLFAKFSGTVTNESKRKLWEEIAANISSVNSGEVRTGKMVKWQDMASIAKRKEACRVRR